MTTTANLGLTQIEVSQKDKEATINTNNALLDTKVPKALADASTAPAVAGLARGATYFNTTDSKVYWLHALTVNGTTDAVVTGTWIALN